MISNDIKDYTKKAPGKHRVLGAFDDNATHFITSAHLKTWILVQFQAAWRSKEAAQILPD